MEAFGEEQQSQHSCEDSFQSTKQRHRKVRKHIEACPSPGNLRIASAGHDLNRKVVACTPTFGGAHAAALYRRSGNCGLPVQFRPGAQWAGYGTCAAADCELTGSLVEEEDSEAAAKPATTTTRARTRTMSFIFGNPFEF
jgi:hypothetical protein